MKKIRAAVFNAMICLIALNVTAQELSNTKWKGKANIPIAAECLFDFKTDTLFLKYIGNEIEHLRDVNGKDVYVTGKDSLVVETMSYRLSGDTLVLRKIIGGSPCDAETVGKYKVAISSKRLSIVLIADECEARADVWPYDSLTQVE